MMDDLISRQAAIDVILDDKIDGKSLEIMTVLGEGNAALTLNTTCDRHILAIKNLPSAQPNLQPTCNQLATDCISRQAAIDAFWKLEIEIRPSAIDAVLNMLKTLPSAQSEIIWCKDCRHATECHKSVQYTRNESNSVTIGYSPIEWCSRGERRTDE